jgi:hypothetical protein
MISPTPRLGGQAGGGQLKTKPCGQTTNKRTTDKVTTFTPGQKVDIKMKEYINHPGYFAVAFDPDGDDSFPFPIANMDKVVAATDDPKTKFPLSATVLGLRADKDKDCYTENADHECTLSITIPNMTCQNCTLQLIQFMYDKLGDNNDNEYYYQCADIKIEGTPASGGAGGTGAGGAAGAGGTGTGGASAGTGTGGASAGAGTGGAGSGGQLGCLLCAGAPSTAGTTSTAGTATAPTAGTTGTTGDGAAEDDGGCGIAKRSSGGASLVAALGLMIALARRRRQG